MNHLCIKNGAVYHPMRHEFRKEDVFISGSAFSADAPKGNYIEIDASGCIVTPGLIDYHVHYFNRGTESGVNPDAMSFPCGITTAVDAGSCGAANYELFRSSVAANSDVRLYCQLLMGSGGQITNQYPEHLEAKYFDREKISGLFARYRGDLVGLKLKMSNSIISREDAEESVVETVKLAAELGTRVVVHITDPAIDLELLCSLLCPGDVVCHCYQGKGTENILNSDGTVRSGIIEARKRGIIFDACNGKNNFDLEVCKSALSHGFKPDVISSDMNSSSSFLQPLHSLPRIMSKYLSFGLNLPEILDAVTIVPARLIGNEALVSLKPGTEGDLSIFKVKNEHIDFCDIAGHKMTGDKVIIPQMTIKSGKVMYCQADFA